MLFRSRLGFSATNNEVEYEVLLEGMSMVHKMGGKSVTIFSDSRLIVSQVKNARIFDSSLAFAEEL